LLLGQLFFSEVRAQPNLPNFEVEGPSPVFDMADKLPLWLTITQYIGIETSNGKIEREANEAFHELLPRIKSALSNNYGGYLIRVNVFVDAAGTPDIPGGEVLTGIGLGNEPLDALAEFNRQDNLQNATAPPNFKNSSFYYWITNRDQDMRITILTKEQRQSFEKMAYDEAKRRDKLALVTKQLPNGLKQISGAEYWADVYTKSKVQNDTLRVQLQSLNQRMAQVQQELNSTYTDYQILMRDLQQKRDNAAILEKIVVVVNLFQGANDLGAFRSKDDKPITKEGNPGTRNNELISSSVENIKNTESRTERARVETLHKMDEFRKTNDSLKDRWNDAGVPVIPLSIPQTLP
jgi:hypothetical protein